MNRYKGYSAYQRRLYSRYDISEEYLRTQKQRRVVQHLIEHVEGKKKFNEKELIRKVSKAFIGTPLYKNIASAFTATMLLAALQLTSPLEANLLEPKNVFEANHKTALILDDDSSSKMAMNSLASSLHLVSSKIQSSEFVKRQENQLFLDDESDLDHNDKILTVIDSSIKNWEFLRDGIVNGEVLILNGHIDPVDAILEKLQSMREVASLNIISHGSSGKLYFKNKVLSTNELLEDSEKWKEIGKYLDKTGDILLYGCNVGADTSGANFIKTLAHLTSADVGASINPTGTSLKGGDWKLEVAYGEVKNEKLFTHTTEEMFQELLAVAIGTDRVDIESGSTNGSSPTVKFWGDKIVVDWYGDNWSKNTTVLNSSDLTSSSIPSISVSPTPTNGQANMEYHTLSSGNMLIMWYSSSIDNGTTDLYYKIVDTAGTEVKSTTTINSSSDELNRYPDFVNLSNGNFVVVWATNGSNYAVREFQANGTAVANQYSATTALGLSSSQYRHSLAANNSGQYMVLATDYSTNMTWGIFNSGSSTPSYTGNIATGDIGNDSVKMSGLPNGNFLVVYRDGSDLKYTVIGPTGSTVQSSTTLGTYGAFEDPIVQTDGFILQYNYTSSGTKYNYMKKYNFDGSFAEDLTNQIPTLNNHKQPATGFYAYYYTYQTIFAKALLFKQTDSQLAMAISSQESGEDNMDIWLLGTAAAATDADASLTASATVTEPVNIATTADTVGEAVNVFDFTISDGGTSDGVSTDITQIVLHTSGTGNFSKVTWRLNGPDASNVTGTYNSGTNTITFSGLSISVTDGGNETYTINGYFHDATGITEGQTFILSVDGDTDLTVNTAKTTFGTTTAVTNGTGSAINVTATKLIFTTQPASSVSGVSMTQPVVKAVDASNNVDIDYTSSITLSESSSGTLSGTLNLSAVAGVATFTDVVYSATTDGESFVLTATDGSLTDATSNSVASDILATKLVFTTQPNPTALQNSVTMDFTTDPVVQAQNANGQIDTDFTETVTLAENGAGTGVFTNESVAAVAGVATFTGLTLNHNTDETFQLVADDVAGGTEGDLPAVTSGNLTVTSNAAPVNTLPSVPTVKEDDGNIAIADDIAIADAEGDAQSVILTATNGTISLIASGTTITIGDGTDDTVIAFNGTLANVNTALDTLTFKPAANFNGNATIRMQTSDGNGGSDDDTLTIAVANAPEVTSINRLTPTGSDTNADTLIFRVTFSESVSGIDSSDFTVSGSTATVTNVSAASGTTTDITVSGGNLASLNATVRLDLVDNDSIINSNSVSLGGTGTTGSGDGSHTGDQSYTVDNTAPTTTITSIDISNDNGSSDSDFLTNTGSQTITATLWAGLAGGEILYGSIDNGSSWSDISSKLSGTALSWDGVTLSGSNTIKLKISDAAGNDGPIASQSYIIDSNAPTFSSLSPLDNATGISTTTNLVLSMNEDVSKGSGNILIKKSSDNSTVEAIDVTSGQVTISGTTVTINPSVTLSLNTEYYIQIPSGVLTDLAGNSYAGISDTTSWSFTTIDNLSPTISGAAASQTVNDTATLTPFSSVTLADNEDDNVSLTITLDDNAKGTLSATGLTGTGPYTIASGSISSVQAILQAVVFNPADNRVVVGSTETTTFSLVANDSHSNSLTDSTTTVISTSINDNPTIATLPTDITVTEETAGNVDLSAATLSDADVADSDFTLKLAAGSGTLAATSGGGVTVGGSGTGTLTLSGSMANIDTFLNTASNIQYTGANAASGDNADTLSVTLNDEDGSGDIAGGSVNIDITALDESIDVVVTDNTTAEEGSPKRTGLLPNQGSFTVVLHSKPTADVTITMLTNDDTEGNVTDPATKTLTFTPSNWDQAQGVTVTGVDDDVKDGDIAYTIHLAASSTDTEYNGKTADANLTNVDNETAGLEVSTTDATTSEDGGTGAFNIVLKSEPLSDVTVTLQSSNTDEGTVSPATLTFTAANWDTPQNVTVTGVDDAAVDGSINYEISVTTVSSDTNYDALSITPIAMSNADDDVAGLTVSTPTNSATTTESGGFSTFTVALNTLPSDDVTITVSSTDTTEGSVSPATLTFTQSNWNVPQNITVTGVDDDLIDGTVAYSVSLVPSSTDTDYDTLSSHTENFVNTDNEQDLDFDGINDVDDNCPNIANPLQGDRDNDSIGDLCDTVDNSIPPGTPIADADEDGIADANDNCVNDYNPNQSDVDGDGVGDVCDTTSQTATAPSVEVSEGFSVTPGGSTTGSTTVVLSLSTTASSNPTDGSIPHVSTSTTLTVTPATEPPAPATGEPTPPAGAAAPVTVHATNSDTAEYGYSVTVAFTIPQDSDMVFTGYWKYGKETASDADHWYDLGTLTDNATITGRKGTGYSISADGKTLTLTLIDGKRGDYDLSANGIIDDPGVPIMRAATIPVPLFGAFGYALLIGLFGFIGLRRIKS